MEWDKDRVRNLRKSLRLTQTEFANKLGCRQQTISEWEQGMYKPANAYGRLLNWLERETTQQPVIAAGHQVEALRGSLSEDFDSSKSVTKVVTTFSLPTIEVPDIFKDDITPKNFDPALD